MATTDQYSGTGKLILRAVTAGGALPLADVHITLSGADRQNRDILFQTTTNESGNTEVFTLPTPSASLSRVPGNLAPYATYDLVLEKEGYFYQERKGVPVFEGVTSLQTVEMIPEGYRQDKELVPNILQMTKETEPFENGIGG